MVYETERHVAIEAVRKATHICLQVQADQDPLEYLEKVDGSPVTVADLACQVIITHHLSEAFPQDLIIAEEDSVELTKPDNRLALNDVVRCVRQFLPNINNETVCQLLDTACHTVDRRFWALDPIDGTKGFLRRQQYAIALALIENEQVQFSILGCPALPLARDASREESGIIVFAVRGQGAFEA
ncbi:3'(2'),5'-bisphosphate nucleotidase, partial [Candidatus Uhrbacteria bacterium]|nr:3'(2'),5'-bisphosphate nucleotidase [Candidatus Uhrbacteria bacterium]